jgi:hypothetical protein
MAKKSFKQETQSMNAVYDSMMPAADRQQRTDAEMGDSLETQGKRGQHLPRINLAFSPNNYEYIRTMSRAKGQNITQFVNDIITADRETNKEQYQKVLDFMKQTFGDDDNA